MKDIHGVKIHIKRHINRGTHIQKRHIHKKDICIEKTYMQKYIYREDLYIKKQIHIDGHIYKRYIPMEKMYI